jgi:hypothetical protein
MEFYRDGRGPPRFHCILRDAHKKSNRTFVLGSGLTARTLFIGCPKKKRSLCAFLFEPANSGSL